MAVPSENTTSRGPRTPLEERIAAAWCELLDVDAAGAHDDFFHSGGNSLAAMALVAAVRRSTGVELPLSEVFDRRTIARLAEFVEHLKERDR